MELYFKLHSTLAIPYDFQVPSCSPWPTWSWQQKMGDRATKLRIGDILLSEKEKDTLESMNFKWGAKGRTPQQRQLNAIKQNRILTGPFFFSRFNGGFSA